MCDKFTGYNKYRKFYFLIMTKANRRGNTFSTFEQLRDVTKNFTASRIILLGMNRIWVI